MVMKRPDLTLFGCAISSYSRRPKAYKKYDETIKRIKTFLWDYFAILVTIKDLPWPEEWLWFYFYFSCCYSR